MTRNTRILLVLFILGALLRLAAVYDRPFVTVVLNAGDFAKIAESLSAGRGFVGFTEAPTAYCEPLIPFLGGAVLPYVRLGHMHALNLANIVVDLLTAWLLFRLARSRFNERVALIAAALWLFYPPAILFTAQFLPDTFFAFFTVLSFWLYDRLEDRGWSISWSILLGLCLGLSVLVKSVGLILLVAYTIYIVLLRYESVRWPRVISGFVILVSALAVFVPWMIRNAVVLDYFALNTRSGTSLYVGNHVGATGGELSQPRSEGQRGEVRLDIIRWQSAREYFATQRGAAMNLWPRKFALLWNTDVALFTVRVEQIIPMDFFGGPKKPLHPPSRFASLWGEYRSTLSVLLFVLPFVLIVLVGTAGIFLVPHFGTRGLFILLLFLTGVVAMVTYGSPRDHFACMPALILSGCAMIRPRSWRGAPEWRRTFLLAFLGLFGGIWIYELLQGLGI